ncbi:TonB-dependent receptor [Dokdonella koreensis]|uniref:TonB-dependent receptor n=1 Tax=Dokdonella koreensis DS-123 TaxID=1300342 RepID=A0A160DV10_9GAMM|nr:TonB-dependent receptor [Dokdonella koreensis]ANB18144.1 TonB-dependent receptor [Dokdonella koreensis DS-123]
MLARSVKSNPCHAARSGPMQQAGIRTHAAPPGGRPAPARHGPGPRSALALALATALLPFAPLHAQAPAGEEPLPRLPTVEAITPSPLPGTTIDRDTLPYASQAADAETIRASGADNLIRFMTQRLTGVNINEVQGSPFQGDLTFHGYRASATLGAAQGISVYLDGIRVNEPFGDIISWDMMPEAAIRSLTVVPGSDALFGPNTLGGALAFTTQSGLTAPGFTADLSFGSDSRKRADLAWGWNNADGWHAFAAVTGFDEDGWRDQSKGHLGTVFAKFGRSTATTEWDVSILGGRSKLIGNGLLPSWRYEDGEREGGLYQDDRRSIYTAPDQTENRQTQIASHVGHWFNDDTLVSALAYVRNGKRDTVNGDINGEYEEYVEECEDGFDADGNPLDDDCEYTREEGAALHNGVFNGTHLDQDAYGAALNLDRQFGRHRVVVGATWDHSKVDYKQYEQLGWLDEDTRVIYGDPAEEREFFSGVRGNATAYSVFASDHWQVGERTFVTGSLRWNRSRVANTLSTAEDGERPRERFTYTKANPFLGITHGFGDWTAYASVSQSNRAPTVMELGCADPEEPCRLPTGLQGDPYLAQVVSRSGEVGLRWSPGEHTYVSASAYRTTNRDDILFLRAPNTQQGYFANFDRTRHQGVDLTVHQDLGLVEWHLGYSWLEATYEAHGELLSGERTVRIEPGMRLAGLPKHTFKLGADWKPTPRLTFGADLITQSDLIASGNEDGGMTEEVEGSRSRDWKTGGFTIVNLHGRWRTSDRLEFTAGIDNVFDRRYETFGMIGEDVLPNGELLRPHVDPEDSAEALFVAPGAPRRYRIGLRLRF